MVLSPASKLRRWSFGRYATRKDLDPELLPPLRSDCDCFYLLHAEGGPKPSHGAAEAFNFTAVVEVDEMHLDIWALHLETMSEELRAEERRQPSWDAWQAAFQLDMSVEL